MKYYNKYHSFMKYCTISIHNFKLSVSALLHEKQKWCVLELISISSQFSLAITSIIIFMGLLYLLERWLMQSPKRTTNIYQGGELLANAEVKYETQLFYLAFIFLILHVIAFLTATIYVLEKIHLNVINWSTAVFLLLVIFFQFTVRGYKVN